MKPTEHTAQVMPSLGPWSGLHRALMPDYNRKATVYWWTVVLLGVAALTYSGWTRSRSST